MNSRRITVSKNNLHYSLLRQRSAYRERDIAYSRKAVPRITAELQCREHTYSYSPSNTNTPFTDRYIGISPPHAQGHHAQKDELKNGSAKIVFEPSLFIRSNMLCAPRCDFQRYIALFARHLLQDLQRDPAALRQWQKRAERITRTMGWDIDQYPGFAVFADSSKVCALAQMLLENRSPEYFSLLLSALHLGSVPD